MHTNAKKSLSKIEAQIGEPLRNFLLQWYDERRCSFREISQLVWEEKGFGIDESTLRKWYYRLIGQPRSIAEAMRWFYERTGWF